MTGFRPMRRSRQQLPHEECFRILKEATSGVLALLGDGDYPYAVPLSHACDGGRIYFHSALEGHKVELLKEGGKASFEMDTRHELEYDESRGYCAYYFESVMGKGTIHILGDEEKFSALEKLMDHYHPGMKAYFNTAAMPRTLVYCLKVEEMTGKRKVPKHM